MKINWEVVALAAFLMWFWAMVAFGIVVAVAS